MNIKKTKISFFLTSIILCNIGCNVKSRKMFSTNNNKKLATIGLSTVGVCTLVYHLYKSFNKKNSNTEEIKKEEDEALLQDSLSDTNEKIEKNEELEYTDEGDKDEEKKYIFLENPRGEIKIYLEYYTEKMDNIIRKRKKNRTKIGMDEFIDLFDDSEKEFIQMFKERKDIYSQLMIGLNGAYPKPERFTYIFFRWTR